MSIPRPDCIYAGRIDNMAASIPISWLKVQRDIVPRSWRAGCFFDLIEQELSINLYVWANLLTDHTSQHTLPISFPWNPFLSCPQTYNGCPVPTASNLRSSIMQSHQQISHFFPFLKESLLSASQVSSIQPYASSPASRPRKINRKNPGPN